MELKPSSTIAPTANSSVPGWHTVDIESFASITTGSKNTQDRIKYGQFPFFVRSQTVESIDSFSFDGEAVLTAGDGVGTGKIFHYIVGKFEVHQRVYQITRFADRVNGKFFYYFFSSHFYNRISQMTAKSSVDSVRRDMISRMPVFMPQLRKEQDAIATALSDADGLIESIERLITKKQQIKLGTMQELLTAKRRLPGFEGKWESKSLLDFFTILSTASNSRADLLPYGDCLYLHYGDIHGHERAILNCACELNTYLKPGIKPSVPFLKDGDLVIADASEDTAGIGKSVEISGLGRNKAIAGLHTFLLRPVEGLVVRGFAGYLQFFPSLREALTRMATGSSVYGISKSVLHNIEMSMPLPSEQQAIVTVLSNMDDEITNLETKLKKARDIKQGMMQQLLTGRIRLPICKNVNLEVSV